MQTFLPYPDFRKSLHVLDYRRLGKQRVEAYQIIRILLAGSQSKVYRDGSETPISKAKRSEIGKLNYPAQRGKEETTQAYMKIRRGADDDANKGRLMNAKRHGGYKNHPAVNMWRGYVNALKLYYNCALDEWITRGYQNRMEKMPIHGRIAFPKWFGHDKFHAAHRSNLLRKDPVYYGQFGWQEKHDLPYLWGN